MVIRVAIVLGLGLVLCAVLLSREGMAAIFLACPEPLAWHQWDCGLFPDDPDIIRVPAHSSGTVVARWAQFGPLYPWRIINHSDDDIAVFLRTPEEFENFRSKAADDPTVELCEVKSRDWTWLGELGQCSDRYGKNPHDCTTACGVHPVRYWHHH